MSCSLWDVSAAAASRAIAWRSHALPTTSRSTVLTEGIPRG